MNTDEIEDLDSARLSLTQATNLLLNVAGSAPSPVLETHLEPIVSALKLSRSALADATLVTAINSANATYRAAIKTALETSQTSAQDFIDNLATTDLEP